MSVDELPLHVHPSDWDDPFWLLGQVDPREAFAGRVGTNPWSAGPARRRAHEVLSAVETLDPVRIAALFSDGGVLRGSGKPLVGRAAIADAVSLALAGITRLDHAMVRSWHFGAEWVLEAEADATTADGERVTVPVAAIWRASVDGLIEDCRVFADFTGALRI